MIGHAFTPDELGDCIHCPLPQAHPSHVPAAAAPQPSAEKRPINLLTKDEGMARAATSQASEDFRTTFFLAMAEVATTREFFSTNDAWDLLEARGYQRSGSAQATGTVGPSGCSIGLWQRTDQKAINTSGNLHSSDDGVRIYKSLILGKDFAEVAGPVRAKAAALREKAEAREAEKATAVAVATPEGAVTREEGRVIDSTGAVVPLSIEEYRTTSPEVRARNDWIPQRRFVTETPWEDARE